MKILKKLLIKDYQNVKSPDVRFRYGVCAGIIGIVSNCVLFVFKMLVGVLSGSITIIADAVNNVSDAGSSVITLAGFKFSARPADKEHPYGHARFEYVSGLIVAIVMLVVGVLLGKASVEKIITPTPVVTNVYVYVVLGVAVAIKLFQLLVYRDFGKSIESGALIASADDSRNDVITTLAVIVSAVIIQFTGYYRVDGIFGAAVSIFIIISSILLVKDTINPLLGEKPDEELVKTIRKEILSYDGVLGIHDLMIHTYGIGQTFAIVHVEVAASADIMTSHDMVDRIERDFREKLKINLSVHMDPIDVNNAKTNELKDKIYAAVKDLEPDLNIHDFRVVYGVTHDNILFDVVIPFGSAVTVEDVKSAAATAVVEEGKTYYFIVDMDRSYE